jgi:hypothetical protein
MAFIQEAADLVRAVNVYLSQLTLLRRENRITDTQASIEAEIDLREKALILADYNLAELRKEAPEGFVEEPLKVNAVMTITDENGVKTEYPLNATI